MSNGCLDPSPQIDLTFTGSFPAPRALRATPILSTNQGNGLKNLNNGMWAPGFIYLPGQQFPTVAASSDGLLAVLYIGGASWLFRYNFQTDFPSAPWEFIGGAPNIAMRDQQGTIAPAGSDLFGNLTGDIAGPTLTLPVNGVWNVAFGMSAIASTANHRCQCGLSINNANPGADAVCSVSNPVGDVLTNFTSVSRVLQTGGLNAGDTISLKYRDGGSSGTAYFNRRWIQVTPVRCN